MTSRGRQALSSKSSTARRARAVVYLRVSTVSQVNTDFDPEGISIPAQRQAVERKAIELNADIVREFVEPGKTATSIDKRPVFQEAVRFIRSERDIDYLIVYHFNRAFRNAVDAGVTRRDLAKAGCRIVSTVLDLGNGNEAELVEGILSYVDSYQSAASGADIRYKMNQKVKNGGSLGRAPLGYKNVRVERDGGGEIRSVDLDPERAPLVRLAFTLYATGDYTLQGLADELTDRGLTTRPGRYPAGPVSDSKLSTMLGDRYYLGFVSWMNHDTGQREEVRGRHEPLVDIDTWQRVQDIQRARRRAGERQRRYQHYLKGSLWCGRCHERGSSRRMLFMRARGNGGSYDYFYCAGREDRSCDLPYLPAHEVESLVAAEVARSQLDPSVVDTIRRTMAAALGDQQSATKQRHADLSRQLAKLDTQEENLLDLAAAGSAAASKIQKRLHDIALQRERIRLELEPVTADLTQAATFLASAISLLEELGPLYQRVGDFDRRQLNQAVFERFYIDEGTATSVLQPPFAELVEVSRPVAQEPDTETPSQARADHRKASSGVGEMSLADLLNRAVYEDGGSGRPAMVGLEGFEPSASTSRTWRANQAALQPVVLREASYPAVAAAPAGVSSPSVHVPPSATVRTARRRRRASSGLISQPSAPDRRARCRSALRSSSTSTGTWGSRSPDSSSRMSMVTAMPPIVPICRSSTATSGRLSRIAATTCLPERQTVKLTPSSVRASVTSSRTRSLSVAMR